MRRSDKWIAGGWALLGATLTVGAAAVITTAQAQDQGQPPAPGQGQPGGGGFGQGGGGGFGGGMRFGGGGAPVITATERFVYVLRGNTLYQFDANGLRLLAQADLPAMAGGGRNLGGAGDGAGGAGTRRRNRTGGDTAPQQQ